ncbi:MAG: tetratricopeptide repeat protein, partial [Burkholderiaceae bacterium]|nr:tetratricopeptide repeat protein [Burkholderiaceae bacterium]
DAAQHYRQALALRPDWAEAHLNLGFVLREQGHWNEAAESLARAAALDATSVDAPYLLGCLARQTGQPAQAVAHFERALALRPGFEPAVGELCQTLLQLGEADRAREAITNGLAHAPQSADLWYFLGNLQSHTGDTTQALQSYDRALTFQPDHAGVLNNQALALQALGRLDEAVQSWHAAIAARPGYAPAHANLGAALKALGDHAGATLACRQAIALEPRHTEAHNTLGASLKEQGELAAAEQSLRQALALRPDHAEAWTNLGVVQHEQERFEDALQSHRHAITLAPGAAEIHCNLGASQQALGQLDDAVQSFEQALRLKPGHIESLNNLGSALLALGRHDDALARWREALALQPDFLAGHSNVLFAMCFSPTLTAAQYLAEARAYGQQAMARARPFTDWPAAHARAAALPLRVGLVSGDLGMHPVGFFLEGVLAHLRGRPIELVAYTTTAQEDAVTARLKPCMTLWRSLVGLSDEAAAQRIRDDGVQLLIDLSGHTAHNRLPVFAWKPAPVQVSWLGYFASTGLPTMDYLLADRWSVPPERQADFSETLWYLPDTRLCFSAPVSDTPIVPGPLPALTQGYLNFGCLQNTAKLNDRVLALWGRIFQALPQARLRLQSRQLKDAAVRERLSARLAAAGIAPARVTLSGSVSRDDYLAAHQSLDIMLDTFPYPGGTTTCEALWMGVPTVTLSGDTLLARQGASMMHCAGLPQWVASTEEDYFDRVLTHAADLDDLARLRAGLRQQVLASPLFDARLFATRLEEALRGMWQEKNQVSQTQR